MHLAVSHVADHAETLRAEAVPGDEQSVITKRTAEILAESGGMRLLLAEDLGGFEAHPNDFFEWTMTVGANQPSAGWIAGVVGVHPWQVSIMDPRVQQEIYGDGRSGTWVASPYAPLGRATKVDGGFMFSGRWPYSTGTDFCDWIILGGIVVEDGEARTPPDMRHFVLPRADYEIVPDTWNVSGLRGTGSKDVQVRDAFVPDYRVSEATRMYDGSYARERRPGQPLYQMMFGLMFPAAIAAGTLGIVRGAVTAYAEHIRGRVSVTGTVAKTDPFQADALARAESDVDASIAHLKTSVAELYDYVSAGNRVTPEQRLVFRRDQVRGTNRAMAAVDELYRRAGSSSALADNPLNRYRRDMHVAGTHICNVADVVNQNYGAWRLTGELPKGIF